jgi:hypothetical protein
MFNDQVSLLPHRTLPSLSSPDSVPRDGRLISLILASKGIDDADERVIHQLLDFAHRVFYRFRPVQQSHLQDIPPMSCKPRKVSLITLAGADRLG